MKIIKIKKRNHKIFKSNQLSTSQCFARKFPRCCISLSMQPSSLVYPICVTLLLLTLTTHVTIYLLCKRFLHLQIFWKKKIQWANFRLIHVTDHKLQSRNPEGSRTKLKLLCLILLLIVLFYFLLRYSIYLFVYFKFILSYQFLIMIFTPFYHYFRPIINSKY